jgi:pimeloyl-ACP methyl ester carboxylesterase
METIRSKDGTLIAYQKRGTGAPLVLIHGTLGSSRRWPILAELEQQFTVYCVDRRGRGESGDAPAYSIEREYEDIAALVDSIGGEVNLLGHSFGGLCVLEAALLTPHIRRLIVYEPSPLPVPGTPLYPANFVERLQNLLNAGDREGVITATLGDLMEMPPHELELLKTAPVFPSMIAAAHTVPRELRAEEEYQFKPERFKQMNVPTLMLLGGESPEFLASAVKTWDDVLPNSRIVTLPGQQHIAHYTAPDLYVREVGAFLLQPHDCSG